MKINLLFFLFLAISVRLYGQTAPAPTASDVTTCYGTGATLHASGPNGAIFNWYTTQTGGTSLISSPDYTTDPLTATTVYYVELTTTDGSVSSRTPVTVTITPIPAAPTVSDATICSGNTATLVVTPAGGTYNWYATATSTIILATTDTYVTPILNTNTDYYVEAASGSCVSTRVVVHVIVNPTPVAPAVSNQTVCSGSTAVLTALGPGGTYSWYNVATGGTPLATGTSFTTPAITANQTYYVETVVGTCTSPRTAVSVNVNPIPAAPASSDQTICSGSQALLSATGTGSSFEWYDAATGGNKVGVNPTFTTPALNTPTTYWVQTIDNGCISPRTAVNVSLNPLPTAPTASGTTICAPGTTTLTATGTGTLGWYSTATGGTALKTGTSPLSYTTVSLSVTKTYYVESNNGTCSSIRTPVTVNVIPNVLEFSYASGTYCKSGSTNPVPTITRAGGTFSALPAGLDINPTTGQINLAGSMIKRYVVTYTNGCRISPRRVAIVLTADPGFSYAATHYCQDGTNASPTFTATGNPGVFTSSPAGLVFVSPQTGVIDVKNSAKGSYIVTNTVGTAGGCTPVSQPFTVTIDEGVTVDAGPNQTVAVNTPVQLAGVVSGAVSTGTWSGGTGHFSNTTDLNAIYTPGPGETSAVLKLTSTTPTNTCGSQNNTVTITFAPKPPAPAATAPPTCAGSPVVLSVTPPYTGVYRWFTTATGGVSVGSGNNYTVHTPTVTTIYYVQVQTTVGGVPSDRTPVTVTVNPIPAAPTVNPPAPVCYGTPAVLTATAPGGTYQWYDSPTGGNLLYTGNPYTTQSLTVNTSYYAQVISATSCTSATRTQVDVVVNPLPSIISSTTDYICSGYPLNYVIAANLPGTTFTFSRAAVAGISNAAAPSQPATTITEALINTTNQPISVTYVITPHLNGCDGTPINCVVLVYPTPVVTSASSGAPICSGTSPNYTIQFSTPGTVATWSRAAVPGISNAAIPSQTSNSIYEALVNTTGAPIDVLYSFNYTSPGGCSGPSFPYTVTVNPSAVISSAATGTICSSVAQNYTITSQVPSATYNWSRAAVAGISNVAASAPSSTITETLINTTTLPIQVPYIITVTNGCQAGSFTYTVTVNPQTPTPVIPNPTLAICTGSAINLTTTTTFPGATYAWSGPNGFTSNLQSPVIASATAANSGVYTLIMSANSCTPTNATITVTVDPVPIANAGPDQASCPNVPTVQLAGSVSGGVATGIWTSPTTTSASSFLPSATTSTAQYVPTAADFAAGSVTLTLSSVSNDGCAISTDDVTITFKQSAGVDAGPDQLICSQNTAITLSGKMLAPYSGTWTSTGSGNFSPLSGAQTGNVSPTYILSAADKKLSSITFKLSSDIADNCYTTSDDMVVTLNAPPTVDAGPNKAVLKGGTVMLTPTVSDANVTYLWTPSTGLDRTNIKNPVVTGDIERVYKLTVTDALGCIASDSVTVKIAPKIVITNTFTPNNDGVNDHWDIPGLSDYTNATVDVFDRSGVRVFHSIGYNIPWDGTSNGKPLPFGTYYYVVDTKVLKSVLSGYLVIIR